MSSDYELRKKIDKLEHELATAMDERDRLRDEVSDYAALKEILRRMLSRE